MKIIKKVVSILLIFLVLFILFFCLSFLKCFNIYDYKTVGIRPLYKKKIAICISGQFRYHREMFINHIDSILSLNGDIFIYVDDNLKQEEKEEIKNFYKPKKIVWDKDKVEKIKNYPINMLYMLKRIYYCNELKKDYEKDNGFKYDVVIRIRPDLILKEYIPENIINNFIPNSLYTPMQHRYDIWWSRVFGPTDMFIMGDSECMNIYSECYLHLQDLESDTCIGENLTYGYYERKIKNIYKFKLHFVLYSMILHPNWQSMKNFFRSKYLEKSYFLSRESIKKCKENNNLSSKKNIQYIE